MHNLSSTMSRTVAILDQISQAAFIFTAFALLISKSAPILIGIYLTLGGWICSRTIRKLPLIPKTEINCCILLIVAALLLSIAFNGDWHEGFRGLNKWSRGLLIFWFSYDFFQDSKNKIKMMRAFGTVFLIACLDGVFQYLIGNDFIWNHPVGFMNNRMVRITSSFGYFGMFACFLIMIFPVTYSLVKQQKSKILQVFLYALFLSLGAFNLYFTRARGAWIALAGMCVLFLLFQKKWWISAAVVLGLLISPFILPKELVFHNPHGVGIDKTVNHRIILWNQALNIIKAKPIFGCGLNTYVKNIRIYNPNDEHEVNDYYAHNGYLQYAAETGILGLLAFLLLIFRYYNLIIPKCLSKISEDFSILLMTLLSVSGFLFYMFFDTIFHNLQPFLLFWIFLGWSLALRQNKTVTQ